MTKNFSLSEFKSKDGAETPDAVKGNLLILAQNLQVLREYFGEPIEINSGYRSPEHNKKVGGAKNSTHLKGLAADIEIVSISPRQVFAAIEALTKAGKMKEGGLKAYATFVHYDVRGKKTRW